MKKIKLDLTADSLQDDICLKLKSLNLLPHKRRNIYTGKYEIVDQDWNKDLKQFQERSKPHKIKVKGKPDKMVSLKIDTLVAVVDHNNEIVGWTYQED